jgi:hypothetical protein
MGRVLICIAASLALCLGGCSDAKKVRELETENAELKKKFGEKLPPAPAMDDWKYPGAETAGNGSMGGGGDQHWENAKHFDAAWTTTDDFDKVMNFYADKLELDKDWLNKSPWASGNVGDKLLKSLNASPKGGVSDDGDKRLRPVRCRCLARHTPSYDISVFVTRGATEKHTFILVLYSLPRV